LAPALSAFADAPRSYTVTEAPAALLSGLGLDPDDVGGAPSARGAAAPAPAALLPGLGLAPDEVGGARSAIGAESPALRVLIEPMFEVTLTPTMVSASSKMNVIPARAQLRIDCRTPPGLGGG